MSFIGKFFSSALDVFNNVKSLFDRNEKHVKERVEMTRMRNQTLDPRINSLQILVHKTDMPVEDVRAGTDDLVQKIKELKRKEEEMNTNHMRFVEADKVALAAMEKQAKEEVECAKKELNEIKQEAKEQKKRLEESLEAERVSNMRVGLMKEQVADIEKKKNAMQSDYEIQREKLMRDVESMREASKELSRANEQMGLTLAAAQYAAEELMRKAPHEASGGIISAVTKTTNFDKAAVKSIARSIGSMENSAGDSSDMVAEKFVGSLPKDADFEAVVTQLRGRISKNQEEQKMTIESTGLSLQARMAQLKLTDKKQEVQTKSLAEALR